MNLQSIRARVGGPQFAALLLLLVFVAQAAYLAVKTPLTGMEFVYVHSGDNGASGNNGANAGPAAPEGPTSSPLTNVMAHALSAFGPHEWLLRVPFIIFGALLGASLWYVARRLYGNAGGYIALTLYAFSPTMIGYSARVEPRVAAAWGAFGCIFTGIAVAHTLYAPREVVLWNWRRITLAAVAIGLGMAAQFAIVLAVPIALAFMLYLVPERRRAALVIIAAAFALGLVLMSAVYGFHFGAIAASARWLGAATPGALVRGITWRMVGLFFLHNGPGFVLLLLVALVTYFFWGHVRFFGTTAPLLTAAVLIVLGLLLPHAASVSFLVVALPFVFVFVAGVMADLLETRQAPLVLGVVLAVLFTHAFFSLSALWRLAR